MNKIFIIIQREFMNRVSKKSFIILTILMPFIMAALILVPLLLSMVKSDERKDVAVVDHTGKYISLFKDNESYRFIPTLRVIPEFRNDSCGISAVIEISDDLVKNPDAATIYSRKEIPMELSQLVNSIITDKLRHDKLLNYNIPELTNIMADYEQKYYIRTVKWGDNGTEIESDVNLAMGIGFILTMLIYIFVMSYGGMVMQSVMEEKTNRIVELMVSSVKPFQLMIGKIIGIGLVGIAQLAIWGVMLLSILIVVGIVFGVSTPMSDINMTTASPANMQVAEVLGNINSLDLPFLGIMFVLNFIGGYIVYASLFAAIGASINEQEDSQQFMMPIILLLIFGLYAAMYGAQNPEGPLAFWCSMIPFTAPIVTMVRIPLDVPMWENILSLVILYVSAFGLVWFSGRIYRVGILMYGKKPTVKEMLKWLTYK